MEQQHIDALLEQYLGLLDEYTTLRQCLSTLQTGVYQNIARANFSGERGMRYGQDHYDDRMQATRHLAIEVDENEHPVFAIVDAPADEQEDLEASVSNESAKDGKEEETKAEGEGSDGEDAEKPTKKKKKNKNPLHWFGLFAPMPLRTAQTQSIEAVEKIIPKLVSVNAQMLNLEIEVRRARKRRAKAEAAAEKAEAAVKSTENQPQTTQVEAS